MEKPDIEMDIASVDKTLDEVRPYLIADGGNVEVVSVEEGNVFLRLQGACGKTAFFWHNASSVFSGTCPSSTATMKMGIERVLKSAFSEQLIEVIQVDVQDTSANADVINEHLNILRPAIEGYSTPALPFPARTVLTI